MSLKHLKSQATEETKTDVLPGSGFTAETGLYPMIIDVAYMDISPTTGAEAMKLHLKMADGSPQEVRAAFWVASGNEKGNQTFYTTAKGQQRDLPGFIQATQVAKIACEKPLMDLIEEEKMIKLWNTASLSEENTKIRSLKDLRNKPILVGVLKVRDNKRDWNVKEGKDFKRLPEERFYNEVDKMFYPNGLSITEANAGVTTPTFNQRWQDRYPAGVDIDRYVQVAGSQPDLPVNTPPATPVASLFTSEDS